MIEQGAERFRYRGSQHVASANSIVTMNPDELHTGEAETAEGWRYRMIYLEPDRLEAFTGVRHWWFSEVVRRGAAARPANRPTDLRPVAR